MKETKILTILAMALLTATVALAVPQQKTYKIGVLVWQQALDYDATLHGLKSKLNATGIGYTFDLKQVSGDQATAVRTLREWKAADIDLIVTIGTRATQLAVQEAQGTPIVFGTVLDPVRSGVIESFEKPGRGATGCSGWVSAEVRLAAFRECVPAIKRLGAIYHRDDAISPMEVAQMRIACSSAGVALKEMPIDDVNDIAGAVQKLVTDGIDALWVPIDEMFYNNMPLLTKQTVPHKLPVVSSTLAATGGDEGGPDYAMLGVTADFAGMGQACVPSIVRILTEGADPNNIPVTPELKPLIVVNSKAAEAIGYEIPATFLARADSVLRGYSGQKIVVSGTGDSQELLRAMAGRLMEKLGEGEIVVPDTIGSSGGIKAVAKGDIDIARVARPLKKNEEGLGLKYRQFATAAIVFVVHPDVTGIDNITTEQIVAVYSGKIRDWNELGARPGKIYPITREAGDSCLIVLNEKLAGLSGIEKPVSKPIYTTQEAVDALTRHSGTIGFIPMPVVVGTKLKVLKVDGVYPSSENILSGGYKLSLPFALVYRDEPRGLSKRFIDFISSNEGKDIMIKMGVVPVE